MVFDAEMVPPWGKFDDEAGTRHHLAHHCADVAACFQILARLPAFRKRLDRAAMTALTDQQLERLAAVVFLHDAGKLHPGFQARGWPLESWGVRPRGHVREGLEIFLATDGTKNLPIAYDLQIEALDAWGVGGSLLRSIISHHGRPVERQVANLSDVQHCWRDTGPYDPARAAKELGALMPLWFPEAFEPGGPSLPYNNGPFEHLVCGLTSLADWLGSATQWFAHATDLDRNYIVTARSRAEDACKTAGVDPACQRAARSAPVTFQGLTGFAKPNPQQSLVGKVDLDAQIVILEAETGSGKTEAALWHYMRLFETSRVDGLYFAVPTRAAAVQLHKRVVTAAQRLFGSASPQPVLAVPGYIKAGEIEGTALPHWRVLWDDIDKAEALTLGARWAAEHSKRYLAAQIAVGTVDQAMLGALTVKHAHLRASSLSRNLLVIDEVHASDAYMTSVQKALLEGHVAVGGYAMLMSATLGSTARASWLNHPVPDFETASTVPYPAVWTSNTATPRSPDVMAKVQKRVAMELKASMAAETAAECALRAARKGARVLVIRNTVDRAIATLAALEAVCRSEDAQLLFRVGEIATLHHSRFAPGDRKRLDEAVEAALTTDKGRIPEGRIVIGTQTLEQSLDIDADLLITDLCPIDVLLQRMGRLHRHRLARPVAFEEPRCIVMVPEQGLAPLLAPDFENGLGAWRSSSGLQGIYRDLSVLELTRLLVESHPLWTIPEMNRFLVESALHPERIDALHAELGPRWASYRDDVVGSELGDRLAASGVVVDRTQPFGMCSFPTAAEERIRTRLGDDNMRVSFAEPHSIGPFGEAVSEVVLPGRWCRDLPVDNEGVEHTKNGAAVIFSLNGTGFRYDRFGLARSESNDDGTQSPNRAADSL